MAGLLANFRNTMIVSFLLSLVIIAGYQVHYGSMDAIFWQAVFRWMHTFFGILWIGLLYYFNFVQIRKMPEIPAELKPGISKYIAPEALFWFRYAALATWIMGVILAFARGYLFDAFTLGALSGFANPQVTFIGLGMWLATIMFFNVWVFIWLVAGDYIVLHGGVFHLARQEDRPRQRGGPRRREGQGRPHGDDLLAHQHAAVAADAGDDDDEPDAVQLRPGTGYGKARLAGGPFSLKR
jgi:hypothetical protein